VTLEDKMLQETTGTLVLEMVPSPDAEQKVLQFLTQYAKKLPASKIKALIKKTPLILGKNIPMERAQSIISGLEEIGATASYLPAAVGVEETADVKSFLMDTPRENTLERTITEMAPDAAHPAARRGHDIAHKLVVTISEVNKEVWLILSMFAIIAAMNYLVVSHRVLLGLYTLPTIFSAYFYGRRHATLTAFFSVLLVGMLMHYNPALLQKTQGTILVDSRWYEILAWGSILIITAYAMGTLYEKSAAQLNELRQTYRGLLVILRHFISNDKYTENHSYRVSIYAAKIASYLGFNPDRIEDVRSAALLHDIGKMEISRQLLYKAASLTKEEFEGMKRHVEDGAEILTLVDGPLGRIIPIILAHHDRYDGSGYHPTVGEEILLEARILAVADVYDSLVSDRPYRKAVSPFEAKEIIEKGSGSDFDPKVVQAFLKAFRRREMEVPELVV
jgi:putative nucleotidyltransferase with HDIG domain